MPVLHDMVCSRCGAVSTNMPLQVDGKRCGRCRKGRMKILWTTRTHNRHDAAVHTSERTALFYSAKENKFSYPGRNDQPVPERLKRRGYERVELPSLRALEQHEKHAGVQSEKAWFDTGSGRSFDKD